MVKKKEVKVPKEPIIAKKPDDNVIYDPNEVLAKEV